MPGLSQLKKFSSDLLSLGDEVSLRAGRGEKPVEVPIPEDTKDLNDADDFVLGLPDEDGNVTANASGIDDISEVAGGSEADAEADLQEFMASLGGGNDNEPDLSSFLAPDGGDNSSGEGVPDLSMFGDPSSDNIPEESGEEPVADPSEPGDFLSGFDDNFLQDAGNNGSGDDSNNIESLDNEDSSSDNPSLDDLFYEPFKEDEDSNTNDNTDNVDLEDFNNPNIPDSETVPAFDLNDEAGDSPFSSDDGDDFSLNDSGDNNFADMENSSDIGGSSDSSTIEDIPDMPEDFNIDDLAGSGSDDDNQFDIDSLNDNNEAGDTGDGEALDTGDNFEMPSDFSEDGLQDTGDFDLPEEGDFNLDDISSVAPETPDAPEADDDNLDTEDFSIPDSFGGDAPDLNENDPFAETPSESADTDENIADMQDTDVNSPFEDFSMESSEELPDMSDVFASPDSEDNGSVSDLPDMDFSAADDIPDYNDLGSDNLSEVDDSDSESDGSPSEDIDAAGIEDFEFDLPDTDTQLSGSAEDDATDSEFEIPGFSDVPTVNEQEAFNGDNGLKNESPMGQNYGNDNDNGDKSSSTPNTLTEQQYKTFLANLKEYPLNVRLAFEELLVKDEFTDDAEFELIEIILNKASARQVAAKLEKMLDISIPVPRDYEHRSAGEYETYKKSLSYQLKNKIIPFTLAGIIGIVVCFGLFNFGKNCIYKPLKANSLYKQGYALLQEREYPLSEIKFREATEYRMNKKWFFNYARGYRDHKQYQRAGKMYKNILYCFNHDKEAGLEYADMELDDLANYEKAEEIVRREILDYYINDADGILKLGDIYLEWGTEKDPDKLEAAREQYASLLQLYGSNDLYLSRMMRYFIRTDNLREVLQLRQHFEPREESLCSDDWTELSGYLLDKYYGNLAPSEEYLRYQIEGLRDLLLRAVRSNPNNPIALYNLSRYFINTNETERIESTLQDAIEKFNAAKSIKNRDLYKYIDSYRLLGEYYISTEDFLQAQEQFAEGLSLYITERDNAGFKGTPMIGKLYEDMGNLKYSISGDYEDALLNYTQSISLGNESPGIHYRVGYINYNKRKYAEALKSFMEAGDGNIKERNLLLAMANTLSIRGDDYAAEGYYNQLIELMDSEIANRGLLLPQADVNDYTLVNTYLAASNNYGVTLHRLARKTGDSSKNAEAIVQFSQSLRAWDALTRNPETLIRMEGSNLAEQNIKYITHPISEFEPAIYTNIPKTLLDNEKL